jgi:hypothetical protein
MNNPFLPKTNSRKTSSIEAKRTRLVQITMAIGFVLIALFAYSRLATMLSGPEISLTYPTDGTEVHDDVIKVIGRATNIASISLDGHPIYTDKYGYFEEKLLVPYGYSILELTAKDRFGRVTSKRIRIIYQ